MKLLELLREYESSMFGGRAAACLRRQKAILLKCVSLANETRTALQMRAEIDELGMLAEEELRGEE